MRQGWRNIGLFVLASALAATGIHPGAAQPSSPPSPSSNDLVATYVEPAVEAEQGEAGQLEGWLFNPKERTRAAMASANLGQPEAAIEPLETAMRLEPGSVVSRYNTGTARLAADQSGALALLQAAALTEPGDEQDPAALSDLLPAVNYNLGNARMKEEDFAGAIEAFKNSLRLDSAHEDAKFNLELAQRLLQEQQEQQEQSSEEQQEQDQQEQDQQEQDQQQQQEQQQDQQPPQGESDENRQGQEQRKESPLPQFRDLPDMSAEEAAAILEAVENLEREQRREEAEKAARKNAGGKKDW